MLSYNFLGGIINFWYLLDIIIYVLNTACYITESFRATVLKNSKKNT